MSNGAETPIQDFDAMSLIFPDTSPSNRLPQWAVRRANFTIVKAAVSANANIATLVDIDHACHVGKTRLPLMLIYAGLAIATWVPVILGVYCVSLLFG
jgi:hypothetical protein